MCTTCCAFDAVRRVRHLLQFVFPSNQLDSLLTASGLYLLTQGNYSLTFLWALAANYTERMPLFFAKISAAMKRWSTVLCGFS
jgi:hypothetical protein